MGLLYCEKLANEVTGYLIRQLKFVNLIIKYKDDLLVLRFLGNTNATMLLKANNAINGNVISLFDSSPVCGNDFALFSCVFYCFGFECVHHLCFNVCFCNGALSFASLEPAEV